MTPIEVIHAFGLGIDENLEEFEYLLGLLTKWTMLQT
jgi:hypothetical protein